jgi:peroxiredoxin
MRPSSVAVIAGLVLAGFTVWITRQAKALERDLDVSSQRIALLDKPAPDFHLTSLDGRPVSPADYRGGKKLLLVFWASWNNGSHPALATLGQLYQRSHTPGSDFEMVGVAVDDDVAAARQFVHDNNIPFPIVLDHGRATTNAYQVRSVPTTLIVDTDGKVIYGSVGFVPRGLQDIAQNLGLPTGGFRMDMRMPHGRGN